MVIMDTEIMILLEEIKTEIVPESEIEDAQSDDYICQECHKAFQYASQLGQHIATSHQADNISGSRNDLSKKNKFAKQRTSTKSRYCKKCDKSFSSTGRFRRHLKSYNHNGVGLDCEVCKKSFDRPCWLKLHQRLHKTEREFVCSVCLKAFRWLNNLKEHMQIHSGLKPHKCDKCEKSFTYVHTLRQHLVTHEAEKPHKCNQCWKSFSRLSRLKIHLLLHSGEKPHKCTVCEKTFLYSYGMRRHQQLHHASAAEFVEVSRNRDQNTEEQLNDSSVKIESQDVTTSAVDWSKETTGMIKRETTESCDYYICLECQETFQHHAEFVEHYTTVCHFKQSNAVTTDSPETSDWPSSADKNRIDKQSMDAIFPTKALFVCSQCDKIFPERYRLRQHQKVHSSERKFECPVCLKRFRWLGGLKEHEHNHVVDRNYECKVCNKRFKRAEYLKGHIRVHSEEKQYLCHVCDKSYKYQTSLRLHLRTHTGVKPFQCEKCAKSFCHLRNLKNHMFTHTDVKPYQCKECNKCFGLLGRLQTHMLSHVRGKCKRGRKRKEHTSPTENSNEPN